MNIVKLQNELKSVPDQALIGYVQNPTGQVPTYLALSELQRRKEMREKYQQQQAPQTTVAEDLAAPAQQPQGIAAAVPQPAPVTEPGIAGLPVPDQMFSGEGMAAGGIVAFDEGGHVPKFAGPEGSYVNPALTGDGLSYWDTLKAIWANQKAKEAQDIKAENMRELKGWQNLNPFAGGYRQKESPILSEADIIKKTADEQKQKEVQQIIADNKNKPAVDNVGITAALPKPMTLDEAIQREKDAYRKMGVDENFYTDQAKKIQEERDALKGEKSQAGWMALAKAGLGMAAGKSPFALQNIATGAMQGIEQYGIDVKDLKKEQNLLRASDQKLAEAQYLQSRGDAQGALKAMDERQKLILDAQQHRDTINAHIQAAKIGAASRSGIDEDTIAKGFAKAVENGEYKNTPEDYLRYKSLFTSAGALPAGVTVTKNK